jgi:signal transduction histidine kinase
LIAGSLYGRIGAAFAAILLVLGITLGAVAYSAAKMHQHEIMQTMSASLAQRLAESIVPGGEGIVAAAADPLEQATRVSPNVEAYILDPGGRVLAHWPEGDAPLAQRVVELQPIRKFLAGEMLPILGDNPRDPAHREIFSAAPIERDGRIQGYVYLILLSDLYNAMMVDTLSGFVLRTAAWVGMLALLLALGTGLAVFFWVTRRLNRLTREVEAFRRERLEGDVAGEPEGDEISRLHHAFTQLRGRLEQQIAEIHRQDELRRELVANVSHDLRTPLTSLLGYLETLVRMDADLSDEQRREYLEIAVRQSRKVAHLAQELFELARLEYEENLPEPELFSLDELVHDIAQKFALTLREKGLELDIDTGADTGFVHGDIAMIERVVTNLVDNAIRHTPNGGKIRVVTRQTAAGIEVTVADTGEGIPKEHMAGLFERDSALRIMAYKRGGGLGLLIARRILTLHGGSMRAASEVGRGTTVSFVLPSAKAA